MSSYDLVIVRLALFVLATTAVFSCTHKKGSYESVEIPQEISQGDILVLLQPLEVESGSKALYFQGGQVVEENRINANAPYCRLELTQPAATKLTIQPQHFDVTKVTYADQAQGHADKQLSTTYIALRAGKSGITDRIACGWPSGSTKPNFLKPEEIAITLDGYFSIEVPKSGLCLK